MTCAFLILVTTSGLVVEKTAGKKASVAVYHGVDGAPLSKSVVADITQFQVFIPLSIVANCFPPAAVDPF